MGSGKHSWHSQSRMPGDRMLSIASAAVAAFAFVGPQLVSSVDCWGDYEGLTFSFEICCRSYTQGVNGHPRCWQGGFTYEICCLPEMQDKMQTKLQRLSEVSGVNGLRELSEDFFRFHLLYGADSGDIGMRSSSFALFEKAAGLFRNTLDDMPKSLSYFDILFPGFGIDCEPTPDVVAGNSSPLTEFNRCCNGNVGDEQPCMQIFEMFANALGHKQFKSEGGMGEYYRDMSEQWAFHHFTPSMLTSSDVFDDPCKYFDDAHKLDAGLAGALSADGEPKLGIVWAKHAPNFRSPKFCYGVYFLTMTFQYLQAVLQKDPRPLEIFEVGAGYGSLPRIIAGAKQRLQALSIPIDVQRYVVLDVRSATDLQHWYLNETLGASVADVQDWKMEGASAVLDGANTAPLRVDLVDRDRRDHFVHAYSLATPSAGGANAKSEQAHDTRLRPLRLLIAINSWHEMPLSEYFWYYNAFVAGPGWQVAADWILYLSNREWPENDAKEKLLLGPGPGEQFQVRYEKCSVTNCMRIFQRST
mmetsp:Transcript_61074/g.108707  ORF Transcript_61074/g.108707 Transcript_61074/m.108707 type:complete len:528 (+) Transcript_61074:109-1692(+)